MGTGIPLSVPRFVMPSSPSMMPNSFLASLRHCPPSWDNEGRLSTSTAKGWRLSDGACASPHSPAPISCSSCPQPLLFVEEVGCTLVPRRDSKMEIRDHTGRDGRAR